MGLTRIKMVRLQRGLRQYDVARRAGIAESYMSKIETGRVKPCPELLARIAAVLDVAPETLRERGGGGYAGESTR